MIIIHLLFSPLEKQKNWTSNSPQAHENKEVQEEDELNTHIWIMGFVHNFELL